MKTRYAIYSAYDALLGQNVRDPADLATLVEKLEESDYAIGKNIYRRIYRVYTTGNRNNQVLLLKSNSLLLLLIDPSLLDEMAQ